MPDDSFPFKGNSSDPWARTAVRAGSIDDVVSTDRRRRSRGPKLERHKLEKVATGQTLDAPASDVPSAEKK